MKTKSIPLNLDLPRMQAIDRTLSLITLSAKPTVSLRRRHIVCALIDSMADIPEDKFLECVLRIARNSKQSTRRRQRSTRAKNQT